LDSLQSNEKTEAAPPKTDGPQLRGRLTWALGAFAIVAFGVVVALLARGQDSTEAVESRLAVSDLVELGHLEMEVREADPAALDRALMHFERAHDLDPDHLGARFGLAWARQLMNQPESWWRELYEQTVTDASLLTYYSLFNLAYAEQEAGRYTEAVDLLEHALRVMPERADGWTQRGRDLMTMGEHERAVVDLLEATRLAPDSARAFYLLGRAHSHLGNDPEAETAWTRALELDPGWTDQIEAARNEDGLRQSDAE
jgi:tetratricopeptide (TPR) repeat protein